MHTVEDVVARFDSDYLSKIDLGLLTRSIGHRFFIESTGIGLLALSIKELHSLQKKNGRKHRKYPRRRIADAQRSLLSLLDAAPHAVAIQSTRPVR